MATASHLPLTFSSSIEAVLDEDKGATPVDDWPAGDTATVSPGYLETVGIPLLRGQASSRASAPLARWC